MACPPWFWFCVAGGLAGGRLAGEDWETGPVFLQAVWQEQLFQPNADQ